MLFDFIHCFSIILELMLSFIRSEWIGYMSEGFGLLNKSKRSIHAVAALMYEYLFLRLHRNLRELENGCKRSWFYFSIT